MTTLLAQMARQRIENREKSRHEARRLLREVLRETIPNQRVFVFGSLLRPGKFTGESDIDLALESEPPHMSIYQLISLLSEQMGRRVDVLVLDECRFKDKILREGELWTLQG
ncbi:MAG: nucleotidyltransferase domain-containing protein [Acidobacteria bacterium]|nr:nucleotidyltransferase domain-containing protein [Acidobacteriota bacterium]